ncbi:MAG: CooT family nickel-binding protein [Bacillota bacterium]|nr:CooT family nickel-binding protein [Bacillota bacterium]
MCEANAYLVTENGEELVLERVDRLIPRDGELFLESIFGQQKILKNTKIKSLALIDHKIYLERISETD